MASLPSSSAADSALLLFAHGARDARWAEPFEAVAERIRAAAPGTHVVLAFLEMMQPDLPTAVAALAAAGVRRVDVVPLFLGTGGHLRKDLPPLVAQAAAAHTGLELRLHPAIGEHAAVIGAIADAARACAAQPDADVHPSHDE